MKNFLTNYKREIGIVVIMVLIGYTLTYLTRYASCTEARIYNEKFGTHYTCDDFFWAKDQINEQTKTINLNVKN